MITSAVDLSSGYQKTLADYLRAPSERSLYEASLLSKECIEEGISPEEIVALHSECIDDLLRNVPFIERARLMTLSLQFLLEIMIAYGLRYKEYLDLRMTETTRAIQMQLEVERLRSEDAIRLEQARSEERIRAQQEATKSKEDFLAFIAHELRTPITVIKGSIEYAVRRAQDEGSERVQRALANAEQGLERLMHLSEELLTLSREEQGTLQLKMELVPMDELLKRIVKDVQPRAAGKQIVLQYEPHQPVPTILGDREWLLTVMENLLGNALKYTQAGGQITVKTITHPRRLQIDIVDTGIGIPAAALPYIFEKYYRVPAESGMFIKGTGLGLALVKQIVDRHGGDVRVESQVGQGSTFSVYLPIADQGTEISTDSLSS